MQFTPEHEALRASVRDLVEREINPHVDEWERAGRFPAHALFPLLAKIGLFGLEYDPAYGGEGADHSFTVVAGEELGRIDCGGVPMGIAVQMAMATPSLHRYGSHELKERFLAPAIRGEMVCSIAVTEPDAGSDVAGLRTRATRDGDEWVINGSKLYITNGAQADWICLLARTSDEGGYRGMSQIVVETAGRASGYPAPWTSSGTGPRTPPSCRSPTCGFRSATRSARSGAGSSSRWSSSSPSA